MTAAELPDLEPSLVYTDDTVTLHHGDALDVLREIPGSSIDAVVTDPPYGLAEHKPTTILTAMTAWASGDRDHVPDGKGFMGRDWDRFVPPPAVWDEALRVLKPGGWLLCFAGTRTVDLMGLSIRLAEFEIRDTITWMHSQGFPKGKAQLKPAGEPIIVARKRAVGPWLNIDGCRIGRANGDRTEYGRDSHLPHANTTASLGSFAEVTPYKPHTGGRWPANVALAHGEDCDEQCQVGCPVTELDAQSGTLKSGKRLPTHKRSKQRMGESGIYGASADPSEDALTETYGDQGGASRFYPTFRYQAKAPAAERPKVNGVMHPTVKPLALMQWLVRLVTSEGGVVLDPFVGSGTTLQAARKEGFRSIGVENEAQYLPHIAQRLGLDI